MKRLTGWYHGLPSDSPIPVVMLLAILLVPVLLGAGYLGIRDLALRSADSMTVTVTRIADGPDGRAGSLVYQHAFGRAVTAQVEHQLNDETASGNRQGTSLPVPQSSWWQYHLAFSWMGLTVEVADGDTMQIPDRFGFAALGSSFEAPRLGTYGSILALIAQASGGAIPIPPGFPRY